LEQASVARAIDPVSIVVAQLDDFALRQNTFQELRRSFIKTVRRF
jgi:hypothetical protein